MTAPVPGGQTIGAEQVDRDGSTKGPERSPAYLTYLLFIVWPYLHIYIHIHVMTHIYTYTDIFVTVGVGPILLSLVMVSTEW